MLKVKIPMLHPQVKEAKIVEWLKNTGDNIEKDEPLLIIETDKTTIELDSPTSCVVDKILFIAGSDITNNDILVIINEN